MVDPWGTVWIRHRGLREPLAVAASDILAVSTDLRLPAEPYQRNPRVFEFASGRGHSPNLAITFRGPLRTGRLRTGADNRWARKGDGGRGPEIDGATLSLDNPAAFVLALKSVVAVTEEPQAETLCRAIATGVAGDDRPLPELVRKARRLGFIAPLVFGAALGAAVTSTVPGASITFIARVVAIALASTIFFGAAAGRILPDARWWRQVPVFTAVVGIGALVVLPLGALWVQSFALNRLIGPWLALTVGVASSALGVAYGALGSAGRRDPGLPRIALPRWRPVLPLVASAVALCVLPLSEPGSLRDLAIARGAAMVDGLPDGWQPCCSPRVVRESPHGHLCGIEPGSLPDHSVAVEGAYARQAAGNPGFSDARIDLTVILAQNAAAAQTEFAAIDSPGYEACTGRAAARAAANWGGEPITGTIETSFLDRRSLEDHDGVIDVYRVAVPTEAGIDQYLTAFVRVRVDRAIIRLPITGGGALVAYDEVLAIIDAVVASTEQALADH